MAKISDCSYMELKKVYSCNIIISGKKTVCCLEIANIDRYQSPKRIHISLSNLYSLMELFGINNLDKIVYQEIKCLVNDRTKQINFISPITFKDKKVESDFIRCLQVNANEP